MTARQLLDVLLGVFRLDRRHGPAARVEELLSPYAPARRVYTTVTIECVSSREALAEVALRLPPPVVEELLALDAARLLRTEAA